MVGRMECRQPAWASHSALPAVDGELEREAVGVGFEVGLQAADGLRYRVGVGEFGGGVGGRDGDDRRARGPARRDAGGGVLDHYAPIRPDPKEFCTPQVAFGVGFAPCTSSAPTNVSGMGKPQARSRAWASARV